MKNLTFAILGPGSVGGFLAALLCRQNIPVTCIVKEESVDLLSKEGLKIESVLFGDFTAYPKIVSTLNGAVDFLLITTKATGLEEALDRVDLKLFSQTVIIPLLNGIEHMKIIRSRFGKHVVAGSISGVEVKRKSINHIVHTTPSVFIKLASHQDVSADKLNQFAELFNAIGIKTEIRDNEAAVLWDKLVRLNAIACTTSASGQPIGYVRTDPWWRKQLEDCVKEAAAVATEEGVLTDTKKVLETIDSLPAGLSTSMHRDVIAGKSSELDAIAGAVVRRATRYNLDCPTIKGLIDKIKKEK